MKLFRASRNRGGSEIEAHRGPPSVELVLEDVSVYFGAVAAVADVSLSLSAPIVGIVGPNGAGKSTLLDGVSGLAEMKGGRVRGSIRYRGHELRQTSPETRSALGIGRSFQHPLLVPTLTVEEHLRVSVGEGGPVADVDGVADVLGLRRWMVREIGELPYGVRKLLDIGRALATRPRLLLCDEPLSGLDESARESMIETLADVAATGTAIMVVEHDFPRLMRLADEVVVMDFGRPIGRGRPEEIATNEDIRRVFLGSAPTHG